MYCLVNTYNQILLGLLNLTTGTRFVDLANSSTRATSVGLVSTRRVPGGIATVYSTNKDIVLNQDAAIRAEWIRKYGDTNVR
jgi:hypothetical protein